MVSMDSRSGVWLIVGLIVWRVEGGGEGGGRGGGGEGLVEGVGGVADEEFEVAGGFGVLLDEGAGRGEEAGDAGFFEGFAFEDGAEEAIEATDVDALGVADGRWREGAAIGDSGGAFAVVVGGAGDLHEGDGEAFGVALLAGEEAAGDGEGLRSREGQGVFEAGAAAVLEGVEVAFGRAGTGTCAAAAGTGRCRVRL